MAEHNETGKNGEKAAEIYLIDNGYIILETNWRVQHAEVDILALDNETLVCVEVKTRKDHRFGPPEAFISARKKRLLTDAACVYAQSIQHKGELRFDIVGVTENGSQHYTIKHIRDAYFPNLINP